MTTPAIHRQGSHRSAALRVSVIGAWLVLAGCPTSTPQAMTVSLTTTQDVQRNARELQKQLDALHLKARAREILLGGLLFFSSGTVTLDQVSRDNLMELVVFLGNFPRYSVAIEGHTDSIGEVENNQQLSQRRADAVKLYLVHHGVDANALVVRGKGEGTPVAENISRRGRQWNRRVEVIIENLELSREARP
jgi:outer membrane protein OmpA-like peptidoglycan-associated protein